MSSSGVENARPPETATPNQTPLGLVSLADVGLSQTKNVGNKAATLGELIKAGLPAQPGLVVCADTCHKLRDTKALSAELQQALHKAIDQLWPEVTSYAIRTSVVESERGNEQDIPNTRCEYFVPRDALTIAIVAAAGVNEAPEQPRQAVLIQPMVKAAVSGTLFSGQLSDGKADHYLVESCWGLGRPLVQGQCDPDRYLLDHNAEVVNRERGRKQHQLTAQGSAGLVRVNDEARLAFTLDSDALKTIAALAKRCASTLATPQDIEFALEDQGVIILQSRPVAATRLNPEGQPPGKWVLFEGLLESTDKALTPLSEDLLKKVLPDFAKIIQGRIYLDITTLNSRLPFALSDDALLGILLERDSRDDLRPSLMKTLRCLPYWLSRTPQALIFWWRSRKLTQRHAVAFVSHAARLAHEAPQDADKLMQCFAMGKSRSLRPWLRPFALNLACTRHEIHRQLLLWIVQRFKQESTFSSSVEQLYAAHSNSTSAVMASDVAELGQKVASSETLKTAFKEHLDSSTLHQLACLDTEKSFLNAFSDFLQRSGHRCTGDIELACERWVENPKQLLALIGIAARGTEHTPANDAYRQQLLARDAIHQSVQTRRQRRLIDYLLKRIRYHLSLRDATRDQMSLALFHVRKRILTLEDKLLRDKKLDRKDDLFFLSFSEAQYLENGQLSPSDASTLIAIAKAQHAERNARPVQHCLGASVPNDQLARSAQAATDVVLGTGAAPGVAEGSARIVDCDQALKEFIAGEILVLKCADINFAPAMLYANAVICEHGSSLGILSTLARRWAIPVVVKASYCTRAIANGEQLRVDGSRGEVQILSGGKKDPGGKDFGEGEDCRRGTEGGE